MRNFLLWVFVLVVSLYGESKNSMTVGLGAYIQTQPYKGAKSLYLPSPVLFYDNGIVYVRWSRVGVYFLGAKKQQYAWGFSLTAQPQTLGYSASDSSYLAGMDERKSTFEGGLALSASYQNREYIEVMLLADMLQTHRSWIAKAEMGSEYAFGDFRLYPSLFLLYEPRKFLDYYYGVKQTEATPWRTAYSPSGGVTYGAQTYIKYPLTKKLSTLLNLRYDRLATSAQNSPLTDKNAIYSGLVSLIYTFK